MKKLITGIVIGAVLGTAIGGFAVGNVVDNRFPIKVNGEEKKIEGYNIDDRTYFKLRDIADAVGGFTVDFKDDTILIDTVQAPSAAPNPTPADTPTVEPEKTEDEERNEIFEDFKSNDFENATVMTQSDPRESIEDDKTSTAYSNKLISSKYADIDGDDELELIIYSSGESSDEQNSDSAECISVWDINESDSITKLLAKAGEASRNSYRYFVISHNNRAYLVEVKADSDSDGAEADINVLDCKDGEFESVYQIEYSESGSAGDYSINGEDVSKQECEDEINGLEDAILFAPFSE